jgi:hypothetical protein
MPLQQTTALQRLPTACTPRARSACSTYGTGAYQARADLYVAHFLVGIVRLGISSAQTPHPAQQAAHAAAAAVCYLALSLHVAANRITNTKQIPNNKHNLRMNLCTNV